VIESSPILGREYGQQRQSDDFFGELPNRRLKLPITATIVVIVEVTVVLRVVTRKMKRSFVLGAARIFCVHGRDGTEENGTIQIDRAIDMVSLVAIVRPVINICFGRHAAYIIGVPVRHERAVRGRANDMPFSVLRELHADKCFGGFALNSDLAKFRSREGRGAGEKKNQNQKISDWGYQLLHDARYTTVVYSDIQCRFFRKTL
jgi:hypothetical protein